ncbi:phosphoribosyltransferase family protein [Tsukamurella sp. 8F]|uniref:phosphoribosyltransferase family protein n=1 Tax=unclassified Tsukamurella TaxID=2633480 RepID=UPI0023BA0620|nr:MULTISPECIES: phosphoribosyltransferase family protein [unclassified Tsukamurella]MDF0530442.1 phosphoribosyltransferase family protein [Tsukamurella sp. 8J]MDF0587737.1 phosphoribosyltransferase family protein [Tsukamurella sp. 8F]
MSHLIRPGLRQNPRRAHLLVSTVLGKHLPTPPATVRDSADALADQVAVLLRGAPATVFGFAETATGLGHCVAARLGSEVYLHSTRRRGAHTHGTFTEGHSHATEHLLQPSSPELLDSGRVLVLVDDEISTGTTALDSIRALHAITPHDRYIVASLVDVRNNVQHSAAPSIEFVSLATGSVDVPTGLPELVADLPSAEWNPISPRAGATRILQVPWPSDVPDGGRHGVLRQEHDRIRSAAGDVALAVSPHLDPGRRLLVVGHEELMYLPLCVAESLGEIGFDVHYQTTTRSPAYVFDSPDYPLRRGFRFISPEPDPAPYRHLYNAELPGTDRPTQILFVADSRADTDRLRAPGGLLDVLTAAGHDVTVAVVPASRQEDLAQARRPLSHRAAQR